MTIWPRRRPPDPMFLAQQHTEDAVKLLGDALHDKEFASHARVRSAALLLDRGWGRVARAPEKAPHPAAAMDDAELRMAIAYVRERVDEQKEAAEAAAAAKAPAGEAPGNAAGDAPVTPPSA